LILGTYNGHEAAGRCLIDHGADIDAGDGVRGNTALHRVGFRGFLPIAQMLIDAGRMSVAAIVPGRPRRC
jgi:ankyrin repeat protein